MSRPTVKSLFLLAATASVLSQAAQAQFPYRIRLTPEDEKQANPVVKSRDFAAINAGHQIVVAVWGSGIDYNQPLLFKNIHFDLSDPNSVGVGYDFSGVDRLASYRILNTGNYPIASLPKDVSERLTQTDKAEDIDKLSAEADASRACVIGSMIKADARVARYLGVHREETAEVKDGAESTRVAGLITGGQSDIGIIPYRVSPYSNTEKEELDEADGVSSPEGTQLTQMLDDLSRPEYQGKIKIVFLAHTDYVAHTDDSKSIEDRDANDDFKRKMAVTSDLFQDQIRKHPEILFVTYPFSSAGWTDNQSLYQFPCGLEADNLLCVGELNERGDIASAQQTPVNLAPANPTHPNQGAHLLFTRPETEQTTDVTDNCAEITSLGSDLSDKESALGSVCKEEVVKGKETGRWIPAPQLTPLQNRTLLEDLTKCQAPDHMVTGTDKLEGPIRAAAEVTRLAAQYWVAHPEAKSGAEIVTALHEQATCVPWGALPEKCTLTVPAVDWKPILKRMASGR